MKAHGIRAPINGKQERAMHIVMSWLGILRRVAQKAGPYLILEMVLPGGTLLALLLFLYQRRKSDNAWGVQRTIAGAMRALANFFGQRISVTIGSES
jgi:hypothetical protein